MTGCPGVSFNDFMPLTVGRGRDETIGFVSIGAHEVALDGEAECVNLPVAPDAGCARPRKVLGAPDT